MKALRKLLLVWVACWSLVALPIEARAQGITLLYCDGNGGVGGGQLFLTGGGNDVGACEFQGIEHVFSQIICNFTVLVNEVLGKIYCGIQYALVDTLSILLTLYVIVFGAQLLMGTTQLKAGEILIRLLKIAGVWVFATQSLWGINYAFSFFVDLAGQGMFWALSSIPTSDIIISAADPANPCVATALDLGSSPNVMPVYTYLDKLLYCAVLAPLYSANTGVIGFFVAMSFIIPPLFLMAVTWLITVLSVLARAVISFLMALSALAFLISLSPIFLSLMLFRATYQFFENWFKYMISYSLQIIIIFACIAMWATTIPKMVMFFNELSNVIFDSKRADSTAVTTSLGDSWGICPYNVSRDGNSVPHIACIDPGFDPAGNELDKCFMIPLSRLATASDNSVAESCDADPGALGPQGNSMSDLMFYVIYHLITLIIISYAFNALLKAAPQIATQLAGPEYIFSIGQGFGAGGFGATGKGATQRLKQNITQEGRGGTASGPSSLMRQIGPALRDIVGKQSETISNLRKNLTP
jgi:type IV secretory pathway VirB6-like protein